VVLCNFQVLPPPGQTVWQSFECENPVSAFAGGLATVDMYDWGDPVPPQRTNPATFIWRRQGTSCTLTEFINYREATLFQHGFPAFRPFTRVGLWKYGGGGAWSTDAGLKNFFLVGEGIQLAQEEDKYGPCYWCKANTPTPAPGPGDAAFATFFEQVESGVLTNSIPTGTGLNLFNFRWATCSISGASAIFSESIFEVGDFCQEVGLGGGFVIAQCIAPITGPTVRPRDDPAHWLPMGTTQRYPLFDLSSTGGVYTTLSQRSRFKWRFTNGTATQFATSEIANAYAVAVASTGSQTRPRWAYLGTPARRTEVATPVGNRSKDVAGVIWPHGPGSTVRLFEATATGQHWAYSGPAIFTDGPGADNPPWETHLDEIEQWIELGSLVTPSSMASQAQSSASSSAPFRQAGAHSGAGTVTNGQVIILPGYGEQTWAKGESVIRTAAGYECL
jgi:hypothetical protein